MTKGLLAAITGTKVKSDSDKKNKLIPCCQHGNQSANRT